MLRHTLVALLVVVVSDTASADFYGSIFNFTGEVSSVSNNIVTDAQGGHPVNLAPPPYEPFSGQITYAVNDSGYLVYFKVATDSQSPYVISYDDDEFGGVYVGSYGSLLDPSNPAGGVQGQVVGNSTVGSGDFGEPIHYYRPIDPINNLYFKVYPGSPGGYLNMDLTLYSLAYGTHQYRVDIELTSVTAVPEPTSLLLTSLGLGALVLPVASRLRRPRRCRSSGRADEVGIGS